MNAVAEPLRVMLLVTGLERGGAETQVVQLALELRGRGCEVCVVSMLEPVAFAGELAGGGVPLHSLRMRPGKPGLRGLWRFLHLLQTTKPEVVHAHLFHANLLARLARLISPVPVLISTLHSLAESGRSSRDVRLRDWLYRLTDWLSDRTVSVSEAVEARHVECRAVSPRRSRVIPNGVRAELFVKTPEMRARVRAELGLQDEFVWLAAGRLMWKKDYATMLLAMAGGVAGTLLIAGKGPDEEALRAQAESLGVRVRFLGLREDIPDLMNACDGFVMSSVVEGLPMVLIEAAMAGLPAVTTNAGGTRDVVRDGETGFVVPVRDAAALRAAMQRLAAMPAEERRRMGEAARCAARERFSISKVASQWEDLYRGCLGEAASRLLP
ncbi:MAG: glycosyltransferase [Bryobacterales bacterium]|nr:glycosyltransferase [Bryobacterales bacterium]